MKQLLKTTISQILFAAVVFCAGLAALGCGAALEGTDGSGPAAAQRSASSIGDGSYLPDAWSPINFGSQDMRAVAYGNGAFIAGGYGGTMVRSVNGGVTWTGVGNGGLTNINAIAYSADAGGNGVFVAVGDSRTPPYNKIAYSSDGGFTWTGISADNLKVNTVDYFRSVAYGKGVFVVGGGVGSEEEPATQRVLRSEDFGQTWTRVPSAETIFNKFDCQAISYADGTWVALGGNHGEFSDDYVSGYSYNSETWTDADVNLFCKGITYDTEHPYFIGSGQGGRITVSATGFNSWSDPPIELPEWSHGYEEFANCAAHGSGYSVVVGEGKLSYTDLSPAVAGNWNTLSYDTGTYSNGKYHDPLPVGTYMNAIAYGDGVFVTVGDYGRGMWSNGQPTPTYNVSGTVTDSGAPVSGATVTINNEGRDSTTTNASGNFTFADIKAGTYTLTAVKDPKMGSTTATVVNADVTGVNIAIVTAPWIPAVSGFDGYDISAVAFGNGIYVAVGDSHTSISTDHVNWTAVERTGELYYTVRFDGTRFVTVLRNAASGSSYVRYSTDGVTWFNSLTVSATVFQVLACGSNAYIIDGKLGASNDMRFSTNLSSWQYVDDDSFGGNPVWSADYGNGKFVAVGGYGTIGYSATGASGWAQVSSTGFAGDFYGVRYTGPSGGQQFWALGNQGHVGASASGTTGWTSQTVGESALYDIAYGNGIYVIAGGHGSLYHSSDGTNWTAYPDSPFGDYNADSIIFDGTRFVAVGQGGTLVYSTN
jgi:hypothetical protein